MTSAVNKPVNTYVFPEFPYYSKEWVPILEAAKLILEEEYFLCIAVTEAATMCETRYGGTAWKEMGAKIRDTISDSLGNYTSVITWHRDTFNKSITKHKAQSERAADFIAYRLAWIDYIIMKCEGD